MRIDAAPGDLTVAVPERALSRSRLLLRGAVGLVGRGSQGAMLAVAVRVAAPQEAADLAVVLAVCTAVNLISNVGIPTLIIRAWRQGWDMRERLALLRAYAWLSVAGGLFSILVIRLLGGDTLIAALGGVACFFQSAYYGAEYWSLAKGNAAYDRFLRSVGILQASLCLLAPIATALFRSILVGAAVFCVSFLIASLLFVLTSSVGSIRALVHLLARPHLDKLWLDAVGVGMATMTMALVYNADTVVLRLTFDADSLSGYRLALLCVSFLVALLPINIFLLADVSTGNMTQYLRIAVLGLCYLGFAVMFALVLGLLGHQFTQARASLLLLSPLAFIRLLCQALASELNVSGLQRLVFGSFGVGVLMWIGIAVLSDVRGVTLGTLALLQTATEVTILALLLIALRRSRARSSMRPVRAGVA